MLARIEHGAVRLFTRNGHDWTSRMPRLCAALEALPVDSAWIDGEAVVLDATGKPDFNALQNAFDRRSTSNILLFVFDLLWLNGTDIRERPLRERRALLRELMNEVEGPLLRFSDDFAEDPGSLVASACKMQLEGIVGKRADALGSVAGLDQAQMQLAPGVRRRRFVSRQGREIRCSRASSWRI
jgi:bifunctional non-homologous end joining protein LigD